MYGGIIMAGVIIACIAVGVMAAVAVFAGIIAAISTVSGYAKAEENDED